MPHQESSSCAVGDGPWNRYERPLKLKGPSLWGFWDTLRCFAYPYPGVVQNADPRFLNCVDILPRSDAPPSTPDRIGIPFNGSFSFVMLPKKRWAAQNEFPAGSLFEAQPCPPRQTLVSE